MAAKTYFLTATTSGGWRTIDESTQAAATNADGWVVSTGNTNHSEYAVGVERAANTFTGTTVPDGTLDTTLKDAFRSTNALNGTFAAGNWTFSFVVRPVTLGSTQSGRVRFRILKADADGSNATEITSGQQQASLTGALANTALNYTSSAVFNPGAFTLTNQYLFIQIAWERTAAGGMTSADANWRTGSAADTGTRIATSNFLDAQDVTLPTLTGGARYQPTISRDLGQAVIFGSTLFAQTDIGATADDWSFDFLELYEPSYPVAAKLQNFAGGTVRQVRLVLSKTGSPTDNCFVTIRTGSPTGTLVATSSVIGGASLDSRWEPRWWTFDFASPVVLGAGTYYFCLERSTTTSFDHYYNWHYHNGDDNADLSGQDSSAGSYTDHANLEPAFVLVSSATPLSPTTAVYAPTITGSLALPTIHARALLDYVNWVDWSAADRQVWNATDTHVFGQEFTTADPFDAVQFALTKFFADADGTLDFTLRAGTPTGTVVATGSVNVSGLAAYPSYGFVSFSFPTVTPTGATTYVALLTRTGGTQYSVGMAEQTAAFESQWIKYDGETDFTEYADWAFHTRVLRPQGATPTIAAEGGGDQSLSLPTLAAGTATFEPTIAPGAVTLDLPTVAAGATAYEPTIAPGAVTLDCPTLTAVSVTYEPTIAPGAVALDFPTVAAGTATFEPTIELGPVTLELPTLAAGTVLTEPTLEPGPVTLELPVLAPATTLTEPTIEPGAVTLDLPTLASGETVTAPSVELGPVALDLPTLAAGTATFEPTLAPGPVTLDLPALAAASSVFAPTTTTSYELELPWLAAGATTTAPDLLATYALELPTLGSAEQVFAPTTTTTYALELPTLLAGTVVTAPDVVLEGGVALPTLTSGEVVFTPTVTVGEVTLTLPALASGTVVIAPDVVAVTEVTLPTLASAEAAYAPTIEPGPVTLDGPTLTSTTVVWPPDIGFGLELPTLAAGSGTFEPTLTVGPVTLTLPTLAETQLFPPTVAIPSLQTLDFPTWGSALVVWPPDIDHAVELELRAASPVGGAVTVTLVEMPGGGLAASNQAGGTVSIQSFLPGGTLDVETAPAGGAVEVIDD